MQTLQANCEKNEQFLFYEIFSKFQHFSGYKRLKQKKHPESCHFQKFIFQRLPKLFKHTKSQNHPQDLHIFNNV